MREVYGWDREYRIQQLATNDFQIQQFYGFWNLRLGFWGVADYFVWQPGPWGGAPYWCTPAITTLEDAKTWLAKIHAAREQRFPKNI